MARAKARRDGFDGAGNVAQIGFVIVIERGRDADDDGVHAADVGVIAGGAESGFLRALNFRGQDAHDIGAAGVERSHFLLVDIEAGHRETLLAEEQGQGQSNVAHAHDTDAGGTVFNPGFQVGLHGDVWIQSAFSVEIN